MTHRYWKKKLRLYLKGYLNFSFMKTGQDQIWPILDQNSESIKDSLDAFVHKQEYEYVCACLNKPGPLCFPYMRVRR